MKYRQRGSEIEAFPVKGCSIMISSTAGTQTAEEGDWLIRDISGKLSTIKGDVFKRTYEAVP